MVEENVKVEVTRFDEYEQLVQEVPIREAETDEPDDTKSLTDTLNEEASPSDMKEALKRLFPSLLSEDEPIQAMIGRIAPDVFLPALRLLTINDVRRTPSGQDIDVVKALWRNYVGLSIGLDGKGRIDMIELYGASKESEEAVESEISKLLNT